MPYGPPSGPTPASSGWKRPLTPMLRITDIAAVCELARRRGGALLSCADNTWPTPVNQLPLALGADLVMHSSTQILRGALRYAGRARYRTGRRRTHGAHPLHSKAGRGRALPAGLLDARPKHPHAGLPHGRATTNTACCSPASSDTHPAVEAVYYPGLESHPGYGVATRQMQHFGGMISFLVKGDAPLALKVGFGLRAHQTCHKPGRGGKQLGAPPQHRGRRPPKTPGNLIRFSVGLEHPEDLKEDLNRGFIRKFSDSN